MQPFFVIPSTTSHKHEALLPTLDVFARFGWHDLDLNLNHIVERNVDPSDVVRALALNGQRVHVVSGGWCDFFDGGERARETLASVDRQVALAQLFGAARMRLFFGRLPIAQYSSHMETVCAEHLQRVADRHPAVAFAIENHDGASSRPDWCRAILERVARPNVALTFDPINFEHRGIDSLGAAMLVAPFVAHVHLKGYAQGAFCGFGEGDVDLTPVLRHLIASGYGGGFTVEYEGAGDRTVRLFESVARARAAVATLAADGEPLREHLG
jgi:sugar phosphate isomerase/epimerase